MKKYNSSWNAEEMKINFNQKQWRQDLAAFISKKLFWFTTRVTRSKTIERKTNYNEAIKEFNIFDCHGSEVIVRYSNKNEIIFTSHEKLLKEYYALKGINNKNE